MIVSCVSLAQAGDHLDWSAIGGLAAEDAGAT